MKKSLKWIAAGAITFAGCKSRTDFDTKDLTIKHEDGSIENPGTQGLMLEVYTGSQNKGNKRIYVVGKVMEPARFAYSLDAGKTIIYFKPTYLYQGKPFEGGVPVWIESEVDNKNLPIADRYSIESLTPTSLKVKNKPMLKSIRGANHFSSGNVKEPFRLGIDDETFKLSIDLSVTPPAVVFDFQPDLYGNDLGLFTTRHGISFKCSKDASQKISPLAFYSMKKFASDV